MIKRAEQYRGWVLYEDGAGLWVVGPEQEPRMVTSASDDYLGWVSWSPTGARLAHLEYTLRVLDVASSSTTDLGTVTAADVESGERRGRAAGREPDSLDEIDWSPDEEHLAMLNELELEPEPGETRSSWPPTSRSGRVQRDEPPAKRYSR